MIKRGIRWLLSRSGYSISRKDVVWRPWSNLESRSPDEEFLECLAIASGNNSTGRGTNLEEPMWWSKAARCYMLKGLIASLCPFQHDVAECGVYQGRTAYVLAYYLRKFGFQNRFWLFDSFEGLPEGDQSLDPFLKQGDFGDTSVELVRAKLSSFESVKIVKGWIPKSLETVSNRTFSLVHVDVDHYSSVMETCAFFYPRLVAPGAMVFDDYGGSSTPGAKQAVDEYFAQQEISPIYLVTGQALVVRYR